MDKISSINIKAVGFDVDGTLTEYRTRISDKNFLALTGLSKFCEIFVVSGGSCERINSQLGYFHSDVYGNYGMEISSYIDGSTPTIVKRESVPVDRDSVRTRVDKLRNECGFTEYSGDPVLIYESGMISVPLLGTEGLPERKITFDPDRHIRLEVIDKFKAEFDGYSVYTGGANSFDIVPEPYTKISCVKDFCQRRGIDLHNVLFVGDEFFAGGNDYSVLEGGVKCAAVRSHLDIEALIADIILRQ